MAATVMLVCSLGTPAAGQSGIPRNQPIISPYLDLFRDDTVALPAYYEFVRPEIERRALAAGVVSRIGVLERTASERGTLRMPTPVARGFGQSRDLTLRATATTTTERRRPVFGDLMHYYRERQAPRRTR
jgi:hypothetical protein